MENSLSQAEIDALLKGIPTSDIDNMADNTTDTVEVEKLDDELELSPEEIDALGEIGNISMGTSATTLFTLLGQKVLITTPHVAITTWEQLADEYTLPYVAVRVKYTRGLEGTNLLILKEDDVKIITDLMMGGSGTISEGELTDFHLSAISEAMSQMIGSAATSMSSMFNKRIEISPPKSFVIRFDPTKTYEEFKDPEKIVKISFKMIVGDLIDSEIMQLLPISFAKDLVNNLLNSEQMPGDVQSDTVQNDSNKSYSNNTSYIETESINNNLGTQEENQYKNQFESTKQANEVQKEQVNVQPVHFLSFEEEGRTSEKHNISLVMDVPAGNS